MTHRTDSNPQLPPALTEMAPFLLNFFLKVEQAVSSAAEHAERQYDRAQLLAAYRRRHRWKASDIRRLNSLRAGAAARKRMERLAGKGRPVVTRHEPLADVIVTKMRAFQALLDPAASPDARRKAFRHWPWWRHHVEALYRGEHALARERGIAGPSDHAERLVGSALGMSSASIHSICGEIRRMRNECEESANFPAMTLAQHHTWMETGTHPRLQSELCRTTRPHSASLLAAGDQIFGPRPAK